jgi:Fic family protein
MSYYIYHHPHWPQFSWDETGLSPLLGEVRYVQGRIRGRMEALGFSVRSEAMLQTLTQDVLKSTEIEGELLDADQVRSSIARRLGLDIAGLVPADRDVEGVVEMMLDATQRYREPLTEERLFNWQASLFPTGRSGMYPILTGAWRDNAKGPMQVVSGPLGRERVHFQAPDAPLLEEGMRRFLSWFNSEHQFDPVLKAGVAHLWFVTLHPFDDGNGRVARAITDMQLARAEQSSQRYYSMSAQIRQERGAYYSILERTQKGPLDITPWLEWFLSCLHSALGLAEAKLETVLERARFWDAHAATPLNERQRLLIKRLQEGFVGKLTSSKWAKIARCSQDTAGRDIQDLIRKGVLVKEPGGGRSTSYALGSLLNR